jgi:ABC-type transport system involved in cytochrome bd biosynthesis fused ATPase/permease subunit
MVCWIFFILGGTGLMIVAYMLEMCLFLPLRHLCAFFHETIKKDSIPSNHAVFGFDKTADKKNDFSYTMYQKASCGGSCQVISFYYGRGLFTYEMT